MKNIKEFNPTQYYTYTANKNDDGILYECDDILTFDIEVTSAWLDENGDIIEYKKGLEESYWNSLVPLSLCYIWQFSYNDKTYFGRNLYDFEEVLQKLPKTIHFIIWVHNLSYEFVFLNNFLRPWRSVFARNTHKPMKAISELYPNIEFRCSYFLTRMSLDTWGKSLGFNKLHTLDYTKIRTPLTHLNKKEFKYCERDCQVVYKGIKVYKERYKHVKDIPLTQTGEVRRVIKDKVKKDAKTQKTMLKLIPQNAYMYSIMKKTFQGGYTHANFTLAGEILENGTAFDFSSSYPAVMCSEKFPMTPFVADVFEEDKINDYAYLMKVKFDNVESITENHYISDSKSFDTKNVKKDNGRIISADTLTIWITEQDWDIIRKSYECDYEVLECYKSQKMYLPKVLIEYVLELYCNKTQYKNVVGKEAIYTLSKQFINSLFGMCVTDLLSDEIVFDGENWSTQFKTVNDVEEYIKDLKTNNKGRTFLAYQFGPWITAYARHNLWECILSKTADGELIDEYVAYCDTDSLKINKTDNIDFSWYNNKIDNKLKAMCDYYSIDYSLTKPVDPKGIERPLGYFCEEDPWTEFCTLGAKRYCYRDKEDGKLHLTVSGINKDAVKCLHNDLRNFNEDTKFDKDAKGVRKQRIVYINNQQDIVWNKGQKDEFLSHYKFGINMRATGYSMSITDEYKLLLSSLDGINHLQCID